MHPVDCFVARRQDTSRAYDQSETHTRGLHNTFEEPPRCAERRRARLVFS